jgi:enoyl-[acyl-carrier protein] reductase III
MIDLTGKVALVTGGSRGIGRAIALRLAEAGADVVVNFVSARATADEAAERISSLGRRVAEVQADVSEPDDVQAMLQWIGETFGRLDILVSNAAESSPGALLAATPERFTTVMNTNAGALILLVQAALPWLTANDGHGKVIAISGLAADAAVRGQGLLGASKAALESTVRQLSFELGDRGINFNAVQAGTVDTADSALKPEDIANTVLFLASPLSDRVQGQTLVVDGGVKVTA